MKKILFVMAAAGLTAAGSMAAAQTIAPQCAVSAASAEIPQGYDVVFDAAQGVCIAAPAAADGAIVSSQGAAAAAGGLGGIGVGGALVGAAMLTFVAVSSTGGT